MPSVGVVSYAELQVATNGWSTVVGSGSYGKVYTGALAGAAVAVKRFVNGTDQDAWSLLDEISASGLVQHPAVLRLLAVVRGHAACSTHQTTDGVSQSVDVSRHLCLVYPLCAGGSLAVAYQQPLSAMQRVCVGLAAVRGLAALHAARVIHYDVKSANVLLLAEPSAPAWFSFGDPDDGMPPAAVLGDMGICFRLEADESYVVCHRQAGEMYDYWPPEYEQHGRVSFASDVYAFGVTLLELMCSKLAYVPADNQRGFKDSVLSGDLALDGRVEWGDELRVNLRVLAENCLSTDPSCRPTAGELGDALRDMLRKMRE